MVGDTLHWILLVLLIINLVMTGLVLSRGWVRRP
jgi:hypothetical protein